MRSWIRKYPWAVRVDIVLILVILATVSYIWIKSNQRAQRIIASLPKERITRIYLGQNLSGNATAITGATIHVDYSYFISHSSQAIETYFLRMTDEKTGASSDKVYALMANGHTYSTVIDVKPPTRDYSLDNRKFDKGDLVLYWRLNPIRFSLLSGMVSFIGLTCMIVCFTLLIIQE